MTNFTFLSSKPVFADFASACVDAERSLQISYSTAAMQTRRALELAVKWVYAHDGALTIPFQDNLSTLLHDYKFKTLIGPSLFQMLKFVVRLGNKAAHTAKPVQRKEAVEALFSLHHFITWLDDAYSDESHGAAFDFSRLNDGAEVETKTVGMQQELERLQAELAKKDRTLQELLEAPAVRSELQQKREEHNTQPPDLSGHLSEWTTRKLYIDLMLELAGWTQGSNCRCEVEVRGMPSASGQGFADYVLYGADGNPVAVIEAKRTSVDPKLGKIQAKCYADCLEAQYGVRPVIFYSNGFTTWFWDDQHAPERLIAGFFSPDELAWQKQRQAQKQPLTGIQIREDICNRHYQKTAIQAVCETLTQGHRKALLVMATGTGKTRTAVALVELLSRHGWIKNVLFLADRRELVKQAKKNFAALLPNLSIANLLESKDNPESRMVFSTYPTMMNAIDNQKSKDGSVLFTPGHFDLIIVDEAHRSIYKKYQDIFTYFDGLLVGLTATPKSEIDHNTYSIFELENDVPTYAYELEEAVREEFLVPYSTIETKLKFLEQGIVYDELDDAEKEQWEATFDEGCELIESRALNEYLFNTHTVDTVLQDLMERGIRVQGGDQIGKTIIFAANTRHADFILARFNKLYPAQKGQLAECIYNGIKYVDSVLDNFSSRNKLPQIAISVDMLDTGIDIPELVNLVFFKKVRSKAKFWQMIGRGTRLCPDLFGIGQDKTEFRIFDYCSNFEFFRAGKQGTEGKNAASLTEQLYMVRARLAKELQHLKYQQPEYQALRAELVQELKKATDAIDRDSFSSRLRLEYVDRYQQETAWDQISDQQIAELETQIARLIPPSPEAELAKRFDLLMYALMLAELQGLPVPQLRQRLVTTAEALAKQGHMEKVKRQAQLIETILQPTYWQDSDLFLHEKVRIALRDLLELIERSSQAIYYTHFSDEKLEVNENPAFYVNNDFRSYRAKVDAYLKEHANDLAIHKLRHNKPLTPGDLSYLETVLWETLGTEDEYRREFGDEPLLKLAARLVGLDQGTAMTLFSEFLSDNSLNLDQIAFVRRVVDYVVANGSMEKTVLNEPPFNECGDLVSLFEGRFDTIAGIVSRIDHLNERLKVSA